MADQGYELGLDGLDVPAGQISFAQLGDLARSVQTLVLRLGRQIDDRSRPGRTPTALSRASEVRLTGLREGSTRLDFAVGDPDTLPGSDENEQLVERFDQIIVGIAQNVPPPWADRLTVGAAQGVARSLADTGAATVQLRRVAVPAPIIAVQPKSIEPKVWKVEEAPDPEPELRTVSGRLEAVDLASAIFRIKDDLGHAVRLEHVIDAEQVGRLVGGRVIAIGETVHGKGVDRIDQASVRAHRPLAPPEDDAGRPLWAPPTADEIGITDDDFEAFLDALS